MTAVSPEKGHSDINQHYNFEIYPEIDKKFPKAIYFIIPNELCERFCFYGIGTLSFQYLKTGFSLASSTAKSLAHLFNGLVYLCPLIGAALSDSYFGKYRTIVALSLVYFVGNFLLTLSSINGLVGKFGEFPLWSYLIPVLLIALGSGGIKPCVASHGGDQFNSSQKNQMDTFFSFFQATINIGVLSALITTPQLKEIQCFGSDCYFLAFGVPTVIFGVATLIFIAGTKYYKFVPPTGIFIPGKLCKLLWYKIKSYCFRLPSNHLNQYFSKEFTDEAQELFQVIIMFIPISFAWMLADQAGTEWQNQYELMDKYLFGIYIPTESSGLLKTLMVIILIPIFSQFIFPFLQKRNINFTVVQRIVIGWLIIIIAFIWSTLLNYWVDQYAVPIYEHNHVVSCSGCLNGLYQLPQMFLHALGDALLSPACVVFAYTRVTTMKAIAFSVYLLSIAIGNYLIIIFEEILLIINSASIKQVIYIITSCLALLIFIILNYIWKPTPSTQTSALDQLNNNQDVSL